MNIHCFHRSLCPLALLLAAPALLSACGQYGDLYLPKDKPADRQQQTQAPADAPADDTQRDQSPEE